MSSRTGDGDHIVHLNATIRACTTFVIWLNSDPDEVRRGFGRMGEMPRRSFDAASGRASSFMNAAIPTVAI